LEVEFAGGELVGLKAGTGPGYGFHYKTGAIAGSLLKGPAGGYKCPAFESLEHNPIQAGEVRVGTSIGLSAGLGTANLEASGGQGFSYSDSGWKPYLQGSVNCTFAPALPKASGEIKWNLIEFAVKPRR
jgi:hypothetical protein